MSEPIYIAHVITRLILGGAQENTLLTVIGQQRNPAFDVTLVIGADDKAEGNLYERARAARVKLVVIPSLIRPIHFWQDVRALLALYQLFRRNDYSIVHTHSSKAGVLGRVSARLAGVPIVIHTLHSLVFHEYQRPWQNSLYIWCKRLCAKLTDVLISVNRRTAEGALAAGIGRPEQHVTIFSGIELEPFLNVASVLTVADAKQRLGIPSDAPTVGKVARLFPLKGHNQFLEAARKIADREPLVRFLLVGDGPGRAELEHKVALLGLKDQTIFAGRVRPELVPDYMQAMDVVVHTSLREGIARVLPQAGAVGKPVVTFDMDGAPEVIRDGISGYLAPKLDTDALASRVLQLLADENLRCSFGAAGRSFAEANFRVQHMVERIDQVYYDLLARKYPGWQSIGERA